MSHVKLIAAGVLFGLAGYFWKTQDSQQWIEADDGTDSETADSNPIDNAAGYIGEFIKTAGTAMTPYFVSIRLPGNAAYIEKISQVEAANGIPAGLMVRLAYQECRFREDIITGKVVSSAGAKGMWQLMPIHWRFVDPLDWSAAADYAGGELRRLFRVFGSWQMALAAYNWGEGNLKKYGIASAPAETRNYYTQILADLGGAVLA